MTTDTELNMTDDDMQTTNMNTIPTGPTGIGARLRSARVNMNLTEKDAATRLHLHQKHIDSMENEDFNNGLPPTFIRGYMRSYARLLNIPEADVDAALQQLGMNQPPSTSLAPKLHTPTINNNELYVRWITYLISGILILLVGIWWSTHSRDDNKNNNKQPAVVAPAITETATPTPTGTAAPTGQPGTDTTTVQINNNVAAPATTTTTPEAVPTAPGQPAPPVAAVTSPQAANTTAPAVAPAPDAAQQPVATPPAEATAKKLATEEDSDETTTSETPKQPAQTKKESAHLKMVVPEPGLDGLDPSDY